MSAGRAGHSEDTLLETRGAWWALIGVSISIRLLFLADPFELHGISDFHGLGQQMLHGALPYRDFPFEYPPLAAPIVLVAGLVPAALSANALAALTLLVELVLLLLLRPDRPALRRYLVLTLPLTPFLSGGFDAVVMLALAATMVASFSSTEVGRWAATLGTLVKLFPLVALAARRPSRRILLPISVATVGLVLPLLIAPFEDTYLGFAVRRGVHQEAVGASVYTLAAWARGEDVITAPRYHNIELVGSGPTAGLVLVAFGLVALIVVARAWRLRPGWGSVDPVLVTHALLLCALCAGKVFSPQYVLVAVPSAAILGGRRFVVWMAIGMLTILPFSSYSRGDAFMAAAAVRNAVLIAETLIVARLVLRAGVVAAPAGLERTGGICSDGRTRSTTSGSTSG